MKKLLILLFAALLIVVTGCSDDSDDTSKTNDNNEKASETTNNDDKKDEKKEDKKVYQIGETAEITSSTYEFPYEVTVNSFELTKDKVDGVSLDEKVSEVDEEDRFAVVNVTIKNTSDRPFVPNEKISAQFISETLGEQTDDSFFTKRNEKLEPGQEISGNLVTVIGNTNDEVFYIVYEAMSGEETKFELPNPEK
ncbi:hypothetical protein CFK37_12170 [Virgibacillus phasianinus]|uniref:DUF4352 domain-containing protein n=1 Tax=Virgibacillus phasianinus TaxID=2017483 RepID=A0A220U408_9BACI|nr:DUF4352 domain-containing protein [Virgibacillus phasianinus]ASK62849.1 hypothetical protein CFK37_12170 [Virgibacillus phasianinus]